MYIKISETTDNFVWNIVNQALAQENAQDILSDLKKLNDFVNACCYENTDWLEGRISTEESSMLTDLVWDKVGGDNLKKIFGSAAFDRIYVQNKPLVL
tara:strand:+ start:196 stop:489 length:294 start_codon:yes stop_codon:yes gene_type:complete